MFEFNFKYQTLFCDLFKYIGNDDITTSQRDFYIVPYSMYILAIYLLNDNMNVKKIRILRKVVNYITYKFKREFNENPYQFLHYENAVIQPRKNFCVKNKKKR